MRSSRQAPLPTAASVLVAIAVEAPTILLAIAPTFMVSEEWDLAADILGKAGYSFEAAEVDAADCGVPQTRKCCFVVAVRAAPREAAPFLNEGAECHEAPWH